MDIQSLMQMVSSVGFPIVCCIYLIYTQNRIEEKHAEEMNKMRETVENNTKVMIKLCTKLGVDVDGVQRN